jgi:tubulin--tyrosine ligase
MELRLHQTSKFHVLGLAKERHPQNVMVVDVVAGQEKTTTTTTTTPPPSTQQQQLSVFLDIDEPYTRQVIQQAFDRHKRYFRLELGPGQGMEPIPLPTTCDFQWGEYERVDWTEVRMGHYGASSYCIRKGLSRKAQLAFYTHRHVCKHPESILKHTMPQTYILDTWAVFDENTGASSEGLADIVMDSAMEKSTNQRCLLDKSLAQAQVAMNDAEQRYDASPDTVAEPVWILKPSTTNKGSGIQIVHLYEQLVDICWSEPDIREWYVHVWQELHTSITVWIWLVGWRQVWF